MRKVFHNIYSLRPGNYTVIKIPEFRYIKTTGNGERNVHAIHTGDEIWSISRVVNRMKDITKTEHEYKFKLMPLEVIWEESGRKWNWQTMMHVPDIVDEALFQRALVELKERNRSVRVPVELVTIEEGIYVQGLHVGPYEQIEETVNGLKAYCEKEGYKITAPRREFYVNQPYCNPPERYQTIVRFPVEYVN